MSTTTRQVLGCAVSGKLGPNTRASVTTEEVKTRASTLARRSCTAARAAVEIVLHEYTDCMCMGTLLVAINNLDIAREAVMVGACSGLTSAIEMAATPAGDLVWPLARYLGWDILAVKPGATFTTLAQQAPEHRQSARTWAALQATVHALTGVAQYLHRPEVIGMIPSIASSHEETIRLAMALGWNLPTDWHTLRM